MKDSQSKAGHSFVFLGKKKNIGILSDAACRPQTSLVLDSLSGGEK